MADCLDKNMIDKDEYPQTAEFEMRCVNILAQLWHAPDVSQATGCSTTGSSEAAMLGGLALKRRWQTAPEGGRPGSQPTAEHGDGHQRPGLLGEVRELLGCRDAPGADGGQPLHALRRGGGEALRREHDRRRGHPRARRSTARTSRSRRSAPRSTSSRSADRARRAGARRRRIRRRSSPRSSTRTSTGTSVYRASPRSTPPATSTASCIPASAGSCGATPRRCRRI